MTYTKYTQTLSSLEKMIRLRKVNMSEYSRLGNVLSMAVVICLMCHYCWMISCKKTPLVALEVCSSHWCVVKELQFDGASFKTMATWRAQSVCLQADKV